MAQKLREFSRGFFRAVVKNLAAVMGTAGCKARLARGLSVPWLTPGRRLTLLVPAPTSHTAAG